MNNNNSSNQSNEQLHSKDFMYDYDINNKNSGNRNNDNDNENEGGDSMDNNEKQNNLNNNNNEQQDEDLEDKEMNLTKLQNEYDEMINELKRQLQISRELRKKSENDKKIIQHRVTLLKNQEKFVMLQFQNTKKRIDQILINRSKAEEKLKMTMMNKRQVKQYDNYSNNNSGKGSVSNSNNKIDKKNQKIKKELIVSQLDPEKEKLKNEIIEKLKEDEAERIRLENEIANIEKEEFQVLRMFSNEQ